MGRSEMQSSLLAAARRDLRARADPETAKNLQRFFKTGPGEYGEGDRFLGIRVPELRRLAREYPDMPLEQSVQLLRSKWHEERFFALILMVGAYERGDPVVREKIHQAYLEHTAFVNNWDLVDASAEHLVGAHLGPGDLSLLMKLGRSKDVWERRIAVMATFYWVKRDEFGGTLRMAELLLDDPHDLVQKGVGWMLREVGKRDQEREERFLDSRYKRMPRTMLRYAIERFPESRRKAYLRGEV